MTGEFESPVQPKQVDSDIEYHIGQPDWAALEHLLESVLDLVTRVIPATSSASITVVGDLGCDTVQVTGEESGMLDRTQYETGQGPCIDAITSGQIVASDFRDERDRWPRFCAVADQLEVVGALAIPLRNGDRIHGVLNVYTRRFGLVSQVESDVARALAAHVSSALALLDASSLNEQLREAIASRQLIGEAKGILMESERCTRDAAFDLLRRASQRTNRKLRDVALDIVDAAERRARDQG